MWREARRLSLRLLSPIYTSPLDASPRARSNGVPHASQLLRTRGEKIVKRLDSAGRSTAVLAISVWSISIKYICGTGNDGGIGAADEKNDRNDLDDQGIAASTPQSVKPV